jgi:hypothetical protein
LSSELQKVARTHTATALATLVELMNGEGPPAASAMAQLPHWACNRRRCTSRQAAPNAGLPRLRFRRGSNNRTTNNDYGDRYLQAEVDRAQLQQPMPILVRACQA